MRPDSSDRTVKSQYANFATILDHYVQNLISARKSYGMHATRGNDSEAEVDRMRFIENAGEMKRVLETAYRKIEFLKPESRYLRRVQMLLGLLMRDVERMSSSMEGYFRREGLEAGDDQIELTRLLTGFNNAMLNYEKTYDSVDNLLKHT